MTKGPINNKKCSHCPVFWLMSVSLKKMNIWKLQQILQCSLCLWCHEQGWHVGHNCQLHHKPAIFCSSLVKSEPIWLLPEQLKFKAKMYSAAWILIEQPYKWKYLHICCFQANLHQYRPLHGIPLKPLRSPLLRTQRCQNFLRRALHDSHTAANLAFLSFVFLVMNIVSNCSLYVCVCARVMLYRVSGDPVWLTGC